MGPVGNSRCFLVEIFELTFIEDRTGRDDIREGQMYNILVQCVLGSFHIEHFIATWNSTSSSPQNTREYQRWANYFLRKGRKEVRLFVAGHHVCVCVLIKSVVVKSEAPTKTDSWYTIKVTAKALYRFINVFLYL